MSKPRELAALLHEYNQITARIAVLVERPAERGHIGEFIAEAVFDIPRPKAANQRGIDGHFNSGPLEGRSVNVKWYGWREGILDVARGYGPDYYLVLTGPASTAGSSRGATRPLVIEHVYLFDARQLTEAGIKPGTAASVRQHLWEAAEIYPAHNPIFELTEEQRKLLELFRSPQIAPHNLTWVSHGQP